MVPLHVTIFGQPPPRISDSVTTSLSSVADWYLEVEFSYIMVFSTSFPLYALPLFLPNKLLCHEIARQSVLGGINKELKGVSKTSLFILVHIPCYILATPKLRLQIWKK
jgi:hypothetical protein